jgi:hypothetical protein
MKCSRQLGKECRPSLAATDAGDDLSSCCRSVFVVRPVFFHSRHTRDQWPRNAGIIAAIPTASHWARTCKHCEAGLAADPCSPSSFIIRQLAPAVRSVFFGFHIKRTPYPRADNYIVVGPYCNDAHWQVQPVSTLRRGPPPRELCWDPCPSCPTPFWTPSRDIRVCIRTTHYGLVTTLLDSPEFGREPGQCEHTPFGERRGGTNKLPWDCPVAVVGRAGEGRREGRSSAPRRPLSCTPPPRENRTQKHRTNTSGRA